jgi:hypothetical protein
MNNKDKYIIIKKAKALIVKKKNKKIEKSASSNLQHKLDLIRL